MGGAAADAAADGAAAAAVAAAAAGAAAAAAARAVALVLAARRPRGRGGLVARLGPLAGAVAAAAQLKNFWDLSATLRNLSVTFRKPNAASSSFQCQIQRLHVTWISCKKVAIVNLIFVLRLAGAGPTSVGPD